MHILHLLWLGYHIANIYQWYHDTYMSQLLFVQKFLQTTHWEMKMDNYSDKWKILLTMQYRYGGEWRTFCNQVHVIKDIICRFL